MKLRRSEILPEHLLYVGFCQEHLDADGEILPELFRLPDFSCNWSRFSEPSDVRYRRRGELTDGCLAMPVCHIHHENFAIAVHQPICDEVPQNYSHCEVRINPGGLKHDEEPPKDYKKGGRVARRAWRKYVILNSEIAIHPEA